MCIGFIGTIGVQGEWYGPWYQYVTFFWALHDIAWHYIIVRNCDSGS
jgi:hypothetical protein